ncbi:O-antigen ligase family protein [Guyparkeria sp. 1SP6A2]|nr:O-antigen ligase family protein [Guyparkeria sp. 1SP6A2]
MLVFVWAIVLSMVLLADTFNSRRWLLISVLILTSAALLLRDEGFREQGMLPFVVMLVLAGLGLLSSVSSPLPAWAILEISLYILIYAAILVLANAFKVASLRREHLIAIFIVLPVGLYSLGAVAGLVAAFLNSLPISYPEPVSGFANIRFFNQFQSWTLPFLAAAFLLPSPTPLVRRGLWQIFVLVLGLFFWTLLWRTLGRGALYAAGGATVLVGLFMGAAGRRFAATTVLLAGLGLLAFLVMFAAEYFGGIGARLVNTESPGRLYLWTLGLELIRENPWLGIGPMHFAAVDNLVAAHPHSAPLQWAIEWGLPAALVMTAFLCGLGIRWFRFAVEKARAGDQNEAIWIVALTASMAAGAAHSLVSGIVVMPASQLMLVVVGSFALATWIKHKVPIRREITSGSLGRLADTSFRVLVSLAAIYLVVFAVLHSPGKTQPADDSLKTVDAPRFWLNGMLVEEAGEDAIVVEGISLEDFR